MRTEGEVNGGEIGKTGKEEDTEKLPFQPAPCQVSVQTPTCAPPERAGEGGGTLATAHGAHQAWKPAGCPSSLGLSRACTQVCGNLLRGPVPKGTSLGGRETKVSILGVIGLWAAC